MKHINFLHKQNTKETLHVAPALLVAVSSRLEDLSPCSVVTKPCTLLLHIKRQQPTLQSAINTDNKIISAEIIQIQNSA